LMIGMSSTARCWREFIFRRSEIAATAICGLAVTLPKLIVIAFRASVENCV